MAEGFGIDPDYIQATSTRRRVMSNVSRAVLVVLALNLVLVIISISFDTRVDGPAGSSIVTTDRGYGAWREVLKELDIPTRQLKAPLNESALPPEAVLVVVAPDPALVDSEYRSAIQRFQDAGGTVITTIADVGLLGLETKAVELPDRLSGGEVAVRGELDDVSNLREFGRRLSGPMLRLVVDQESQTTIVGRSNNVILLSDMDLLTNRNIGEADNGILAVRLVGDGPVFFDEYVHGFGAGQGVAGLPAGMVSLALILTATVVWMWAVGSRFGPAQQPHRALPPPRAAYLDGIAATLAKSKPTDAGFGMLRARARTLLDLHSERFAGAEAEDRRRVAATAVGITDEELAALDQPTTSPALAVQAAAVAAKVERSRIAKTD